MKLFKLTLLLVTTLLLSNAGMGQNSTVNPPNPDHNGIYWKAEVSPEFPGGEPYEYPWIDANTHMPQQAVMNGLVGKVWVKFCVNEDGSISNVSVNRGLGFGCDEEAVRVISSMPKWTPGTVGGKAVKTWTAAQVNFNFKKANAPAPSK